MCGVFWGIMATKNRKEWLPAAKTKNNVNKSTKKTKALDEQISRKISD
jgi:hypothetical protein